MQDAFKNLIYHVFFTKILKVCINIKCMMNKLSKPYTISAQ